MDALIQTALIGGGYLLCPLLLGRWSSAWLVGFIAVVGAAFYAVRIDALSLAAIVHSTSLQPVLMVLVWVGFVHVAWRVCAHSDSNTERAGGKVASWRSMMASRLGLGGCVVASTLFIGDVAAALVWASGESDSRQRSRIALTASAAGLLSPLGTASTLLLGDRALRVPLGFLLLAMSWPRGRAAPQGTAGLPSLKRSLAWMLAIGMLCCIADTCGTLSLAREGLGWLETRVPYSLAGVWALTGSALAALGGEEAAALVASVVLADGQGVGIPNVTLALGSGLAVGGLAPLLVTGCLRVGWRLWLTQVVTAAVWSSVLCAWRFG